MLKWIQKAVIYFKQIYKFEINYMKLYTLEIFRQV